MNDFKNLIDDVKELSELFEQKIIFIGGIATYLYCIENELPEETSHDANFMISDCDYIDLKLLYNDDLEENNRLQKSQIIINGIEYDVYKGSSSSLLFSYDELAKNAVLLNNISIPALEHLLCLKIAAYDNRRLSKKGDKDARNIIKIVDMINRKEKIDYTLLSNLSTDIKFNLILNLE